MGYMEQNRRENILFGDNSNGFWFNWWTVAHSYIGT